MDVNIARAEKAQRLLEDPEFQAAFIAVKDSIISRIEGCPVRDMDGLHDLHLMLKLLNDVRANIVSVINTGKITQDRINWLERVKRGVIRA